ncbi:MAG: serine/threonine-protein phosphatase [Deltaproteobacteria bacterium]|nr:MAG: serine/threonine-protein phosphatase [Deltaproteobacteria bacterium]
MDFVSYTDRGLKRDNNEDALLALPEKGIFAVADGLGGHSAGEIASSEAMEIVKEFKLPDQDEHEKDLVRLVRSANRHIWELSLSNPNYSGMGTTLTLMMIRDGHAEIAHVGDSRIYLFREGNLTQLTTDHTLAEEWKVAGKVEGELSENHSANHIVTRALGIRHDVEVDYYEEEVQPGDLILLCTDGLNKHLDNTDITNLFTENKEQLEEAKEAIREEVFFRGATDNLTFILINI